MAGILLTNAGNAILYNSVPWSHRLVSLKTQSFPKGAVPSHLLQYLFAKGGVPAGCARETAAAVQKRSGWEDGDRQADDELDCP